MIRLATALAGLAAAHGVDATNEPAPAALAEAEGDLAVWRALIEMAISPAKAAWPGERPRSGAAPHFQMPPPRG